MDPTRWQRICDLFDAVRTAEVAERDALLAASPDIADDVRELLGHHETTDSVLDGAAADPLIDNVVGPYRIKRKIGQGGMGAVYLAEGPDGPVALKRLHPQLRAEESIWKRFQREAELGTRIQHPNVVRSLGVEGEDCLIMELVEGRTLEDVLAKDAPLPESECRRIASGIAAGLVAIHAAGAVHRDLKPSNVIIANDGTAKVMDLGIALPLDDLLRLSATGQFVGTARYCAPEQLAEGKAQLDGRADLYALGLILYELATGTHPIPPGGLVSTMRAHLTLKAKPLRELNAAITPAYEALVLHMLAKAPGERLVSAEALVEALR